jgi:hypothetical protein
LCGQIKNPEALIDDLDALMVNLCVRIKNLEAQIDDPDALMVNLCLNIRNPEALIEMKCVPERPLTHFLAILTHFLTICASILLILTHKLRRPGQAGRRGSRVRPGPP